MVPPANAAFRAISPAAVMTKSMGYVQGQASVLRIRRRMCMVVWRWYMFNVGRMCFSPALTHSGMRRTGDSPVACRSLTMKELTCLQTKELKVCLDTVMDTVVPSPV